MMSMIGWAFALALLLALAAVGVVSGMTQSVFLAGQTLIRGSRHHEGLREILAAHSADPSRLPCDRSRKAVETELAREAA